jgi:hypothetical protein
MNNIKESSNNESTGEYKVRIFPRVVKSQVAEIKELESTAKANYGVTLHNTDIVKISLDLFLEKVNSDPSAFEEILKQWRYI